MTTGGPLALSTILAWGDAGQRNAFREIIEILPLAVYTTDPEGLLTYFNDAARRLTGRTPQIGTDRWCVTWKIFLPDGTPLPHDQCPLALTLKGVSVPSGIEFIGERPDGTRFWFAPYPDVWRDSEGNIVGGVNVLVDVTDRKNAEITAGEQFRAIVETTPGCVKIVARDGNLLFMNPQGLLMVGADSAEAIAGTCVYDIIAPEDRERFREFNERICSGAKGSMEFDIVTPQGIRRSMETHSAPLRHVDGSTVQLGITHDASERKLAERASLLLSAIVDSSDDAIISKDLNGVITSWNHSAERLFGYTAAETVGHLVTMLIPSDRLDEEPGILARLRRGERVDHFETIRRRKDGVLLDVSLTISPVKDSRGNVIGASKIVRDITPRKRAEDALRASEERFRLAQQAAKIGVFEWEIQADLNRWSVELEVLYGLQPGAFGGTRSAWEDLVHPEDRAGAIALRDRALVTDGPVEGEWRVIWPDGTVHWLAAKFQVYRDGGGQPARLSGVNFEITERKRVENELRRANADLEQFAFSASHDLQEPLRMITSFSQLLLEGYKGQLDGEAETCVEFITQGTTRMRELLAGLLAYTQVGGDGQQTLEPIDLNRVFQKALENCKTAIDESKASITVEHLPVVTGHEPHFLQLFQNLISNAIKYRGQAAPRIHCSAAIVDGIWRVGISDNGIGIAPEYHQRIFGVFKRLHGKAIPGTGIGLAICQRVVERYGGRIWVESRVNEGATFYFTLPVAIGSVRAT